MLSPGWTHHRDVHYEGGVRVAVLDANAGIVVSVLGVCPLLGLLVEEFLVPEFLVNIMNNNDNMTV